LRPLLLVAGLLRRLHARAQELLGFHLAARVVHHLHELARLLDTLLVRRPAHEPAREMAMRRSVTQPISHVPLVYQASQCDPHQVPAATEPKETMAQSQAERKARVVRKR